MSIFFFPPHLILLSPSCQHKVLIMTKHKDDRLLRVNSKRQHPLRSALTTCWKQLGNTYREEKSSSSKWSTFILHLELERKVYHATVQPCLTDLSLQPNSLVTLSKAIFVTTVIKREQISQAGVWTFNLCPLSQPGLIDSFRSAKNDKQ